NLSREKSFDSSLSLIESSSQTNYSSVLCFVFRLQISLRFRPKINSSLLLSLVFVGMITRILSDLMDMPTAVAAGESVLGTIKIAVMPIAKVFTMCFLGLLIASKYVNILPPSGRKLLNGLVFTLLLPCLIFSQLGQAVTLHKMLQWWFIPVNVVLGTISGSLIGFLVATIIRPPYPYFKFTIIQIGVGNIGNVPLVLLAALCRDKSNPFGDSEKCSIDGTAYISFGQWVGAIILYTYVYQMFTPPPEGFGGEEENLPLKNVQVDAASPEQVPLLTQNHPKDTLPAQARLPVGRVDSKITQIFVYLYEKLKLKQIIQPAIISSILAMILGAIPFTKKLIFTNNSPLFFFTDSCMILG
uniref:Uncharacterized protein n=1 Tax=Brassica oleracea var. oleracea TaxID=109376 RepID=A0A0D3CGA0_BRAOL